MTDHTTQARRTEQLREQNQRQTLKKWQDARAVGFAVIVLKPKGE